MHFIASLACDVNQLVLVLFACNRFVVEAYAFILGFVYELGKLDDPSLVFPE